MSNIIFFGATEGQGVKQECAFDTVTGRMYDFEKAKGESAVASFCMVGTQSDPLIIATGSDAESFWKAMKQSTGVFATAELREIEHHPLNMAIEPDVWFAPYADNDIPLIAIFMIGNGKGVITNRTFNAVREYAVGAKRNRYLRQETTFEQFMDTLDTDRLMTLEGLGEGGLQNLREAFKEN